MKKWVIMNIKYSLHGGEIWVDTERREKRWREREGGRGRGSERGFAEQN